MKTMICFAAIIFAISTLPGCATSRQTYTADGEIGHSINCSGGALTWGICYEKAGQVCGVKGYEVLEKSGERGASVVANSTVGLIGGSTHIRSMIIKCKDE